MIGSKESEDCSHLKNEEETCLNLGILLKHLPQLRYSVMYIFPLCQTGTSRVAHRLSSEPNGQLSLCPGKQCHPTHH